MATKYVLVDFENVRLQKIAASNVGAPKFRVFLGASQLKIPLELVQALQPFDTEYIRIDGNGSNALDFHIAFYIGRLASHVPSAEFCVLSSDKGFDPLVRHINGLGISCRRCESMVDALGPVQPPDSPTSDQVDAAVENLAKRKAARPRTLQTLRTALKAFFADQLGKEAIELVIKQLTKRGVIRVAEGKIEYQLPS